MPHAEVRIQNDAIDAIVATAQQILIESAQPVCHRGQVIGTLPPASNCPARAIERMQKPLTAADRKRLEDSLAATSFCTLDSTEKTSAPAGRLGLEHPQAPGRKVRIALNDDLLTARSAISASCSSNWPDRKRSTNISDIRRHSRYD
jgi:hypothetical protein